MRYALNIEHLEKMIDDPRDYEIGAGRPMSSELFQEALDNKEIDELCRHLPWSEMIRRNWINTTEIVQDHMIKLGREFLSPLGDLKSLNAYCRRTLKQRSDSSFDQHSLIAWIARVLIKSLDTHVEPYNQNTIDKQFVRTLIDYSVYENGPLLAKDYLSRHGICLIIERHFPNTSLDGVAMLRDDGIPVIGMTLRYDRIDNFWFTLVHELAHVSMHLHGTSDVFVDDIYAETHDNREEIEADRFSSEALVPNSYWMPSRARRQRSAASIGDLAGRLKVHPAIIAGKIRYETKNYKQLNDLVGQDEVRKLFGLS